MSALSQLRPSHFGPHPVSFQAGGFSPFNLPPQAKPLPGSPQANQTNFSTVNDQPTPSPNTKTKATHFAMAGALFTLGLATHHLPGKAVKPEDFKFLLPPDWKSWARVGLGIGTVGQLNRGMDWKPPAWLTGVESAAVITPMALRFTKTSGLTFLLVAPLVAGIVQTSQWANKAFVGDLKKQWNVPEPLSRLVISLSVGTLGILGSLMFHKQIRNLPVEKLPLKNFPKLENMAYKLRDNLKEILGPSMLLQTCPRGCTPSIICLSEIGEMMGGMWHWFQNRNNPAGSPQPQPNTRR